MLSLDRDGAELHPQAANDLLTVLQPIFSEHDSGEPGRRLFGCAILADHLGIGSSIGRLVAQLAGMEVRPVRAILFDKNPQRNWPVGWHQDRVIAVRERMPVTGYGSWTLKSGVQHVAPPAALLERMITVRIHIDSVDEDNAPLLIAPGSHALGLVPEPAIDGVVKRCGTRACLAEAGDLWCNRTLILHASEAATRPRRRRVLQVDYSPDELPGGLEWRGLGG